MERTEYLQRLEAAPSLEPDLQEYFMDQLKTLVLQKSRELGRPMTDCIQTFGCQMNA